MRKFIAIVLGVLLALGAYFALAAANNWWPFNDDEAVVNLNPTPREKCATEVHFYANNPLATPENTRPNTPDRLRGKTGVNDNGPAFIMVGDTNIERTVNFLIQLHNRRCEDAALVVQTEVARGLVPYADASARIAFYLAEREEWRKAVDRLEAPEALAKKEIGYMTNDYWSFFMRPGTATDPRPTIGQDQLVTGTKSTMLRMTLTLPNGVVITEEHRMECGGQISGAKAFRDVPRMSELPSQSTTTNVVGTPPVTTTNVVPPNSTDTPPPVTTTTTPPTKLYPTVPGVNLPGHNGPAPVQQDPVGQPAGGQPPVDYVDPGTPAPTTVPRPPTEAPPVVVDPEPSNTSVAPPPEDW